MNEKLEHKDAFIYRFKLIPTDKIIMFGDFHGSFHTFFRLMLRLEFSGILTEYKLTDGYKMVFCGDILDRGQYILEIVTFILQLIIKNPENVIYNRGNHEVYSVYKNSFKNEMYKKEIGNDIQNELKKFLQHVQLLLFYNIHQKKYGVVTDVYRI